MSEPTNGSLSAVPDARHLVRGRLESPAAGGGRGRSRSRTGRVGSRGRASRRARAARPCVCRPFSKRQPGHAAHRFAVLNGQSKRLERIGLGTVTSIPPTASISSRKRSKSTSAMWLTGRPVRPFTRAQSQRRPPDLVGRVDLGRAVVGDLDAEIARNGEEGQTVLPRISAHEHDRVGAACTRAHGRAVGAEHEDRRRRRREQAVLLGRVDHARSSAHARSRPRCRSRMRGSSWRATRRGARRGGRGQGRPSDPSAACAAARAGAGGGAPSRDGFGCW